MCIVGKYIVSIVLPTYNRPALLRDGLASIRQQVEQNWELIVVDDGSTDCNRQVVEEFQDQVTQKVTYIYQDNAGAGVARQRGLEATGGSLIAFMDSDDPWLPHHLKDCVEAFEAYPDVDWIVAPARVVNELTGETVHENSFFSGGTPRPHLALSADKRDDLFVIDDAALVGYSIVYGFPGGLQASVCRSWIKDRVRFRPYRLFDDNAFRIEAAAHGARVAYFTEPHINYRIHDQNVSLVNDSQRNVAKRAGAYRDGYRLMLELAEEDVFSPQQKRLLRHAAAGMAFWCLGYNTYWNNSQRLEAYSWFCRGVRLKPTDWRLWASFSRKLLLPFGAGIPRK